MCTLRFFGKRFLILVKFVKKIGQIMEKFPKPLAWWCHIYAETAYTLCHHASGFSTTCYFRQCGAMKTL